MTVDSALQRADAGNPSRWLIIRAIRHNGLLLGIVFVISLFGAFLEGITFGFIALALDVLSSDALPQFAGKFPLGDWIDAATAGHDRSIVFTMIVASIIGVQVLRSVATVFNSLNVNKTVDKRPAPGSGDGFPQSDGMDLSVREPIPRRRSGKLHSQSFALRQ